MTPPGLRFRTLLKEISIGGIIFVLCGCGSSKDKEEETRDAGGEQDSTEDAGSGTDSGRDPISDAGDDGGGGSCVNPEPVDTDSSSGTESVTGTDTSSLSSDSDAPQETDSNVGEDTGTGLPPQETDSNVESESDTQDPPDTDNGTEVENGTETENETETDTSGEKETDVPPQCPDDMVYVSTDVNPSIPHAFCIDRFEASRSDATADSSGVDNTKAISRKGVLPWYVNPMTADTLTVFKNACSAAGKRICESDEWFASCGGAASSLYVFGDTFSVETCNSVDTFCDDYCLDNDIPMDECHLSMNCGYSCGRTGESVECFHVMPTGSFEGCTNELGTFDIGGNVWEVVPSTEDARGYEVRGGAFNCASPSVRLRCSYNADWTALYAGFRCCKDPA